MLIDDLLKLRDFANSNRDAGWVSAGKAIVCIREGMAVVVVPAVEFSAMIDETLKELQV